jgi:hypothetical protein
MVRSASPTVPPELSLDRTGCLGERTFAAIVERVRGAAHRPALAEFGAGTSTVRFALALPGARLVSFESTREFAATTAELLARHCPGARVEIAVRRLRFELYGPLALLSFARGPIPPVTFDCVLVDGPGWFSCLGREACLYQIHDRVRVGGLVFLDDYSRDREREAVRHWLSVFDGSFELEDVIAEEHEVAVLRKTAESAPRWEALIAAGEPARIERMYSEMRWAASVVSVSFLERAIGGALERGGELDPDVQRILHMIRHHPQKPEIRNLAIDSMRRAYGVDSIEADRGLAHERAQQALRLVFGPLLPPPS